MNQVQRKILKVALGVVGVTLLFPPFNFVTSGATFGLGFGFLFSAPLYNSYAGTVDVGLLLTEWLAIAIVCGILWALKRDTRAPWFGVIASAITTHINKSVDVNIEVARINANAIIEAAEIGKPRPAQMDLLDHYK